MTTEAKPLPRSIRLHEVTEADRLIHIHAYPDGPDGAPAGYRIMMPVSDGDGELVGYVHQNLKFQYGPICENGVNGLTLPVLLAIVIDRIHTLQMGEHPCEENKKAEACASLALRFLHERTKRRQAEVSEGVAPPEVTLHTRFFTTEELKGFIEHVLHKVEPNTPIDEQPVSTDVDGPPRLRCHCRNVAMGSHEMSVVVPTPEFLRGTFGCKTNKDAVSIDLCIVPEILWLWSKGVLTLGSCCGHGKQAATICVEDSSIATMHELGYQLYPDHPHVFYSRSIPRHDVQPPSVAVSDDSLEQLLFDLAKRAGSLPSGPDQDWAFHFSNRLRQILSNQSISEPATHPTDRGEAS